MGESSSTLGHLLPKSSVQQLQGNENWRISSPIRSCFCGIGLQATLLFGRCGEPRSAGGTVDVPLKMRGGMVSEPSFHLRQDFAADFWPCLP